jgi:hypothetical protein
VSRIYRGRLPGLVLALGACATIAGCAGSVPTPVVVYVTPATTPSPLIVYVTPGPTATAAATAVPTEASTATAEATAEASAEATAGPSVPPTLAPGASPTSRAEGCSGNQTNKDFFAEAAAKERFDVSCAVPPTKRRVQGGEWTLPNGGKVVLGYKNSAGALIEFDQGNFCTTSPAACSPHISTIGSVALGDMTGTLTLIDAAPTFAIYVAPGTAHAYAFAGRGMTQAQFKAWAAALIKVPKS